jgi:hypothetical protein
MRRGLTPTTMLAVIGPPVIAAIWAWFLSLLPTEVFDFALIWVLISLPPAMLFGHCALSSER